MTSTGFLVDDVVQEQPLSETIAHYDRLAETFEQDMVSGGILGPSATAKFVSTLGLRKEACILDAGAGTGRLGRLLKEQGYTNLHALDGSAEMLRLAHKVDNYRTYTQALLGYEHKAPFADDHFDAVVMVGVFCPGHFGPDVLPELVRITKPGGILCWGQRPPHLYGHKSEAFQGDSFQNSLKAIIGQCPCTLDQGPVPLPNYYKGVDGYGYVLRKNL